jgi:hypothetical protein
VPASSVMNKGFIKCPDGRCSYSFYVGLTEPNVFRRTRLLSTRHKSLVHPPSIGKTASSPGANVKSAGGSSEPPAAARAFVSAPTSTLGNIARSGAAFTSNH